MTRKDYVVSTALKIILVPVIGAGAAILAPVVFALVCLSTATVIGVALRALVWLICGN